MLKLLTLSILLATALSCATNEEKLGELLKKNPKLVFDAIEENPDLFIEVVNRAARKAQEGQYEKQVAEIRSAQEADLKQPKQPALAADRRLIGDGSEKIVIVEYADFQCPACGMGFEALSKFKEKRKGQIQFYAKNMPLDFHKMAYPAALYFEAIRLQDKEKARKFHDYLFENQKRMTDETFLKKAAAVVRADLKRLEVDVKADATKRIVEADMAEFQKFGFNGTPVVIINGVAMHGAQSLEELERVAELSLKR